MHESHEGGSQRRERDFVEIEGARPVWIEIQKWDPTGYQQLWPALGVPLADAVVLHPSFAEAPPLEPKEASAMRVRPSGSSWPTSSASP